MQIRNRAGKLITPHKRAKEEGIAGVDREPIRLWRTAQKYCPRHAVWIGSASPWANPWMLQTYPLIYAHGYLNKAKPKFIKRSGGPEVLPPRGEDRAHCAAFLANHWLQPDSFPVPASIFHQMQMCTESGGVPPPWTIEQIRAELQGRDLVDEVPHTWASHGDLLLKIANAPPRGRDS
jgi:hypothetical protein